MKLAGDHLALLVTLVPYLRARDEPVPVAEAAEHFGVDAETIRDAVRLIAVSGAPGEVGTYQDLDLFDIDWDALEVDDEIVVTRFVALEDVVAMSGLETTAILAGLQYLRQLPGLASGAAIDRLVAKLAPGEPDADAGGGARVTLGLDGPGAGGEAIDRSGPDTDTPVRDVPGLDTLGPVEAALRDRRRLSFDYRTAATGEVARRTVDPLRLESLDEAWYLRAWCLDREGVRTFHLDRMRDAIALDERAERHAEAEADETGDMLFTPGPDDPTVTLEVDASMLPRIREYLPDRSRVPKPDARGRVRVDVRAGSWLEFARLAASAAGRVRVVAPPEARAAVAAWARAGLAASEAG